MAGALPFITLATSALGSAGNSFGTLKASKYQQQKLQADAFYARQKIYDTHNQNIQDVTALQQDRKSVV